MTFFLFISICPSLCLFISFNDFQNLYAFVCIGLFLFVNNFAPMESLYLKKYVDYTEVSWDE